MVLDNYDSFTYNLVQYLGELGAEVEVRRNDRIGVGDVIGLEPEAVVVSPGPGIPEDAGITVSLMRELLGRIPVLGVCLGEQALVVALGGALRGAKRLMHGKVGEVRHQEEGIFRGIPDPFMAMRYHSLIVDPERLPRELTVTAWSDYGGEREIMGIEVPERRAYGVQFHPESVGTPVGKQLLDNFLTLAVRAET